MAQITEHFRLSEFAVSPDYPDLAAAITFDDSELIRLTYLCRYVLEPLRRELDQPVIILSGKRTRALNKKVRGSRNSDHLYNDVLGRINSGAADITARDFETMKKWLLDHHAIIKELGIYNGRRFCHVAMPDSSRRYGRVYYV